MRQILQRAHLVLGQGPLPTDMDDGALGAERGRNSGHRVGAAGPGGRDDAAEPAGLTRVAVGGVRGNLLVTHVDDADALIDTPVVDVDDVAATEREDRVDAFVLQGLGDQVPAGNDIDVTALSLERVLRSRRTPVVGRLGRRLEHECLPSQ